MPASNFTSSVLTIETVGHVGLLWLDRPAQRNAMGTELFDDLPRAMAALSEDDDVRAVVLAARGPHFSIGLDLKAMGPLLVGGLGGGATSSATRSAITYATIRRLQASISSVAKCPKPVIAAVHGYCLGGGVDLIAACDVRLAASDAVFSVREAKVAIVADLGSLQRLPGIIGAGHVAELALTGTDIDAARAASIGLVNHVETDAEATVAKALAMAEEIAGNSPLAVQGTKAVLRAGDGRSVDEGLEFVAAWNTMYLASNDLAEAMAAFVEKRPPIFDGS